MSLTDFKGSDWKVPSEGGIGRPKPLRNRRTRRGRGTIDAIRAAKCQACRLCGATGDSIQAHHLISRGRQGRWDFDNIVGLCDGPGTFECHRRVTENDPHMLRALAQALSDSEYAYVVDELGEGGMERLFGPGVYDRAIGAEATESDGRLLDG